MTQSPSVGEAKSALENFLSPRLEKFAKFFQFNHLTTQGLLALMIQLTTYSQCWMFPVLS